MLRKIAIALAVVLGLVAILVFSQYRSDLPVEQLKAKYTDAQSKYLDLDGISVHYKIEGTGPVLVLLHGTSSSLHTWDGWTQDLKDSFTIVRLDYPGFGITGPCTDCDYSVDYYTDFIHLFMEKLGIQQFYLAGNSLGGLIAWKYALRYPQQVQKLILVDAAGYKIEKIPFAFKLARTPGLKMVARYITPRSLIKKSILEVYGDDSKVTDSLIERYDELMLREGNRAAFLARANGNFEYNTAELRSISMPTLIMWGDGDKWIPVKNAYLFEKDIKDSELKVYKGIGHIPMEELPQETANDARAFLIK
ncbi:MAG: alpha/beta hydrolase [Chitinophagales bacterium]|nr:alpha/beta hydrolase [Chitinophagales bacterium]